MSRVVGVDGGKTVRGVPMWVGVVLEDGVVAEAFHVGGFATVMERCAGAAVVAVDMPIGLTDDVRASEVEARQVLGARSSTLFESPPPGVLDCPDYVSANALCRRVRGKGFSKQAYNLLPRVAELAAHLDERVFEVHPELCFAELAGEVLPSKKSWLGLRRRLDALDAVGIELTAALDVDKAGIDDVVDAAVAAWTATRIAAGTARHWPESAAGPRIWA